jgi:type II secretory pathway pseudopilin PulG
MTESTRIRRPRRSEEEGYILIAVIFILAMLILSLSVALPKVKEDIQRDREIETMHRGEQYTRAIQLYYRKFHAYPPTIDALVKTNEIRFLRKRYIDPMTGKDDWKPIHFGENKTPTAMGFFGKALMGSTMAGTGPSGGNGIAGATTIGGGIDGGSGGGLGSSPGGTSPLSSSPTSSPIGTGPKSGASATSDTSATGSAGSSPAGTETGASGPTFGGAGIIGVSPGSSRQSILVYKKKNHYNEWEFTYDPLSDQKQIGGSSGAIGQPASGISGGIGGGIGGTPTGPGTTPGPMSPTAPTQPTNPSQP